MTKAEQKELVIEFMKRVAGNICAVIDEGKVPEKWDGHELRCYVAHICELETSPTVIRKHPRHKRAQDYRKELWRL